MHGNDGLSPRVVALGLVKDDMTATNRIAGEVFASELGGGRELLPEGPILVLNVLSEHRWVMTHLQTDIEVYMFTEEPPIKDTPY